MSNPSLVTTLVVRLLIIGLLLTLANVGLVMAYYGADQDNLRREKLEQQIDHLREGLSLGGDGQLVFEPKGNIIRAYAEFPDAYAFRIEDPAGRLLAERNARLIPESPWSGPRAPDAWSSTFEADGRPVVVGSRRVEVGGAAARVTFVASGDPSKLFLSVYYDELFVHVIISLLPFAAVLLVVNAITVRQSLRSLVDAAAAVRREGPANGIRALPTAGLPSEVLALVEAINSGLERLQNALEAEQAFTAEAAHALRTPLAILAARIDKLSEGEGLETVRADVAALSRLVNQLLSAAHADTLVVDPGRTFDLTETARTVVAGLAPLAIEKGRRIALEAPGPVVVRGDSDALAHALRNLVENAIRFTAEGTEVLVRVEPDGRLKVLDEGPGIPDAEKLLVTKRFWRGASGDPGGTGLGLSIVQRIAAAHHTRLTIKDRPGGGAIFEMALNRLVEGNTTSTVRGTKPF